MSNWHPSQRGYFAGSLHFHMQNNPNIFLLTGDLGYGMFEEIARDFPDRFINFGAAEQAMLGAAVGLALEGKIPFAYSITPFLIYRPFEWIRDYVNHEKIPVRLVGSGRDDNYKHDGFTHSASDVRAVLDLMPNIVKYWPNSKEAVPEYVELMITENKPCFISLVR